MKEETFNSESIRSKLLNVQLSTLNEECALRAFLRI